MPEADTRDSVIPHLQRRVEDHQLGAGRDQVIAAVGLHEPGVHIVLRV